MLNLIILPQWICYFLTTEPSLHPVNLLFLNIILLFVAQIPHSSQPHSFSPYLISYLSILRPWSGKHLLMLHDIQLWESLIGDCKTHSCTDVFIILISSFKLFHMGSQVGIDNAEGGVMKYKSHSNTTFVSLVAKVIIKLGNARWNWISHRYKK